MRATSYVCNYARFHQELVDYSKQCEVPFTCTPHNFCLSSSAHLQKKYAFASKNFITFGNHGAMTFVWPLCGKPYLLHATEPPRQTVNWLSYTIYSCATPFFVGCDCSAADKSLYCLSLEQVRVCGGCVHDSAKG